MFPEDPFLPRVAVTVGGYARLLEHYPVEHQSEQEEVLMQSHLFLQSDFCCVQLYYVTPQLLISLL